MIIDADKEITEVQRNGNATDEDRLEECEQSAETESVTNPFYMPQFIPYLIRYMLPFYPMQRNQLVLLHKAPPNEAPPAPESSKTHLDLNWAEVCPEHHCEPSAASS